MLDVKILDAPCHAAGKAGGDDPQLRRHPPTRILRSTARARPILSRRSSTNTRQVTWKPDAAAKRVNLDSLTPEEVASWKHGDRLLLSGKMLTGRDAAHKRIKDMLEAGEELPVDFKAARSIMSALSTR